MKKYLSLIAVLALLVACMIPAAFAAGQITLEIGTVELEPNQGIVKVKVPVYTTGIGVAAGDFGAIVLPEGVELVSISGRYEEDKYMVMSEYNDGAGFFFDAEGSGAYDIVGTVFSLVVNVDTNKIGTYEISIGNGMADSVDSNMPDSTLTFNKGKIIITHNCVAGAEQKENVVAPTCTTEGGYDLVVRCTICNEIISSEHVTEKALGHKDGEWTVVTEATCTTDGKKVLKCAVCNEVIKEEAIPAKGHTAGEWVTVFEPTCTEDGMKQQKCSVCNVVIKEEILKALGHDEKVLAAVAPTCTETGLTEGKICARCNVVLVKQEVVDALGHKWGAGVAVGNYDCDKEHDEKFTCSVCKAEEVRKVEGHEHKITKYVTDTKTEKVENKEITYDFVVMKCAHGDSATKDFHGCSYAEEGKWVERSSRPVVGDITPAITMAALTVVAIISGAAYMLIKRKAI